MVNTVELFVLASLFLTPAFVILKHCVLAPTFFAIHPAANALAHLIFSPAAVYIMIQRKSVAEPKFRATLTKAHFALQTLALVSMSVGGAAAYLTKDQYGKPHFTSTHSWIAGTFATLWFFNYLGGFATTFAGKRIDWLWKNPGHRVGGVVAFIGCGVAAAYGVYSGSWGESNLGADKQFKVAALIGAAYAGLIVKALVSLSVKPVVTKKKA